MGLIQCKECNNQVSEEAMSCPHCGVPFLSYKITINKRLREKICVALAVAAVIAVGFGFIHVIRGSNLDFPFHIVPKDSFGYNETFVNIDKITGMPIIAAKSKYPIGCKVLQKEMYIESDEQFDGRVKREFEEDLKKAQAEFTKEYEKMIQQY